jgi:HlyD family secretion protein
VTSREGLTLSRDKADLPIIDFAAVRQFQSETDAIREAPEPLTARITVILLAALVVILMVLTVFSDVERTVTNPNGKIVLAADTLNVYQAFDPSIIKSINVREGEVIESGHVIATLDPTFAAADVRQYSLQVASLTAQIAREEAELAGKALVYPPTDDPDLLSYEKIQMALHEQMMANYKSQIDGFDAQIKQYKATINKYEVDASHYNKREGYARQLEEARHDLEKKGFGTLINTLMSQDQRKEMLRYGAFDDNSLKEARETLAATQANREAFVQQWRTQISQELVAARSGAAGLDAAVAARDKAVKHKDLVVLTAAERSVALTVAPLSVGSVLIQGATLYTLMPADAVLEGEIQIYARDVAFVRANDRCNMKLDAFNFVQHGLVTGKVRWVSEGAFTTDINNQPTEPYYKARCTVDTSGLVNVPANFRLIPGMTLTGDVEVGSRSLFYYMIGGMLRGIRESMREPE